MKHVCLILATFAACIAMMHAATNDYIWSQKPASGPLVSRNLTPVVGRLVGFPSSINAPDTIIIGSGLTLTGSTLSASGSGSVATDSIFDAAGDLVQGTGANTSARVALGTSGQLLRVKSDLSGVEWATVSGTGTVTSVAMSVPSILSVAGSPVTTSGTLAVTLATQAANRIFAGPATGADATPAFRALVADDIPSLSGVYQPLDADLTTYAGITPSANVQTLLGSADYAAFKTSLSLGSVENTALSTWAGTTNITTLGTITTGTWTGTAIGTGYLASGATLDTEWDTAAEINAATTDADFLTTTAAASAYQPLDADLTTLSSATAAGLALMDDADASAQRTTLGLASAALLGANQIFTDTNIFAVGPTEELVVLAEAQGLRLRDNAVDTNTINLIEVQDEDGNQTLVVDSGGALTAVGGITAASFSGTGSALTGINASNIASGTVATARLGTGTANSTTFLRGDGTWTAPSGSGTVTATSGTLTASAIMVGNGTTDIKALASLGTTTTVLHGNAAGLPTFSAVSLTADVSGTLPVANGGTGATALTDLITLATHTTGNYVATIADSGAAEVTVANSGTEAAGVTLALASGITRDAEIDTSAELFGILGDETGSGTGAKAVFSLSPTFIGDVKLNSGVEGSNNGVVWYDVTSNFYVKAIAPSLAASYTLTWPTTDGASSQVLTTDGSGVLTWSSISSLSGYVAPVTSITGTANEITVTGTTTPTLSLPATIDLGGKTSFEIPNGAAPTVDAFGEIAGDNDLWAASRGAPVFFDGTAATALVNVLVSDAPSNGQVPKWNTGGTITWEADNSGGTISGTDTQVMFFDGTDTPAGDAGMTYNKTTNVLTAAGFVGALTGNASTVTTNANMTGDVTSSGSNATTLAAISGSGPLLAENASIRLDPAGSADGKYSGTTVTGTAGATLAFGDVVVLDVTDSRWELADANSAAAADGDSRALLGICVLAAASDGSATTILLHGIVRADTAFPTFTISAPIYVSETAGDATSTQPTTADVLIRVIGHALTADEIFFNPDNSWITHL